MPSDMNERIAPDGQLWVCMACGKTAEDRYGLIGAHTRGWDASCMLNAVLLPKDRLEYGVGDKADRVVSFIKEVTL